MNARSFRISGPADRDIDKLTLYFNQPRIAIGARFLSAVERTFDLLRHQPGVGVLWQSVSSRPLETRCQLIDGFKNYIIFYLVKEDEIVILRVLHGAQDWQQLLSTHTDLP